MDLVREAGWPIYPILFVGVISLVAGWRYARSGARDLVPLVIGLAAANLLLGIVGTALGVQASAAHIGELPPESRYVFLLGLRESLHNLTVAGTFAVADVLLLVVGAGTAMRRATA